jgi:hypothetical protein
MSLNRHFWSMGNPMSELTLIPRHNWLLSHKMTMNLGSGINDADQIKYKIYRNLAVFETSALRY